MCAYQKSAIKHPDGYAKYARINKLISKEIVNHVKSSI